MSKLFFLQFKMKAASKKTALSAMVVLLICAVLVSASDYVKALVGVGPTGGGAIRGASHAMRQPASNVAPGSQVAYYPLDGDAKDYAQTGQNNLTDNNTVTQATTKTNAAQFTAASSEYLSIADNAALSTGDIDFSMSMWVYLDSKAVTHTFYAKDANDGTNREFIVRYDIDDDKFIFRTFDNGSILATAKATTLGSPSTATWYFIVAWHDSATNTVYIQVNNGTADSGTYVSGSIKDTSGDGYIGAGGGGGSSYVNGRIDAVGFWKRTLSSAERTQMYNGGRGRTYQQVQAAGLTTSLQAYWDLNESSGTRNDSSGANHLTDNNTVTSNPGVTGLATGGASQFTASNSEYLSKADNADLSTGNIDFSVAGWVYLDSKVTGNIISRFNGGNSSSREFRLEYSSSTDRFFFETWTTSLIATATADSLGSPSVNTWYYVVAWHNAAADTINIQVNNGTVDSAATGGTGPSDTVAGLYAGATEQNASTVSPLDGRLDQLGYWKRVLTTDERTSLYNSGFGRPYRDLQGPQVGSLVSYWDLEEASGTRNDAHYHGQNSGTVSGATVTTGKFGRAYSFDGVDDKISFTQTSYGTANSASFWINFTDSGDGVVIGNTANAGYAAYIDSNSSSTGKIYYSTGSTNFVSVLHGGLTSGQWANFTIVRSGTSVSFYRDGAQIGTTQTLGSDTALTLNTLGSYSSGANPTAMVLDDVRLYDTALSATQVTSLYGGSAAPACDQSCVGWYKFDSTATAIDSSPVGNDGTNSVVTGVPGIYSGAYSYNATTSYTPAGSPSQIDNLTTLTASAWVYPKSSGEGSSGTIIFKGDDAGFNGWAFYLGPTRLIFYSIYSTTALYMSTAGSSLALNTWQHVAVTWSGTTATSSVKFYINGKETAATTSIAGVGSYVDDSAEILKMGNDSALNYTWDGFMDDIRLYNRALQPYEIHEQFLAGRQ